MYRLKETGRDPEDIVFSGEHLAALIGMVEKKQINQNTAKEIFARMFVRDIDPEEYARENGLWIIVDEGLLDTTIDRVIKENPQAVTDYQGGKERALKALIGKTMAEMKGKADPVMVQQKIKEKLG
jgi:aspartyl-tRNA(Asn)/glutamyl-tRNA(Gln) amidotransferase subunit B